MKLYVASSWRNPFQPDVVQALRTAGHEAYDFRNPEPGNNGFHWSEIDPDWKAWDAEVFRDCLQHPIAEEGFTHDWNAMRWADAGVLLLPSGRSAHLEAGYFVGADKPLFIMLDVANEPELMYKMATAISTDLMELLDHIALVESVRRCRECGCTELDCSQCVDRTGEPCFWIEDDLCSACTPEFA